MAAQASSAGAQAAGDADQDADHVRERRLGDAVAERHRERGRAGHQLVEWLERAHEAQPEDDRARGAAPAGEFIGQRRGEQRVREARDAAVPPSLAGGEHGDCWQDQPCGEQRQAL